MEHPLAADTLESWVVWQVAGGAGTRKDLAVMEVFEAVGFAGPRTDLRSTVRPLGDSDHVLEAEKGVVSSRVDRFGFIRRSA